MKQLTITIAFLTTIFIFTSFKPEQISWTAIGDSITYLNDHPEETGNRLTKGYLTDVVTQLPNIHYINQGHNGWPATGIAEKIETLGILKSDVYTILLGTNDWWYGKPLGSLKDYRDNTGFGTTSGAFRIIINKIRSLNPEAKIILLTPMQRSDFVYIGDSHNHAWGSYKAKNGQTLSQFADEVDSIAAYEHIPVVDLYYKSGITVQNMVKFKYLKDPKTGRYKKFRFPDYESIPFNADSDKYPYPPAAINDAYDGLHPSNKGCKIIAGMLIKEFRQLGE